MKKEEYDAKQKKLWRMILDVITSSFLSAVFVKGLIEGAIIAYLLGADVLLFICTLWCVLWLGYRFILFICECFKVIYREYFTGIPELERKIAKTLKKKYKETMDVEIRDGVVNVYRYKNNKREKAAIAENEGL